MTRRHLAATCVMLALLAGCTTPAPRPVPPPIAPIAPPAAATTAAPPAPVVPSPPDLWQRLRTRFAMPDCAAPAAVERARFDTRNRRGFEARMQALLPLIEYIEKAAAKADVAGEFVLLPWVESHFRQTLGRHGSTGMWQIVPITARATGLPMRRGYDGRLDTVASTQAVMRMLAGYHDEWHDWRLVDMAYNAGETRVRRIVTAHGMPDATPTIPDLPVGHTTHQHLVKLLAIACVIREPERFQVSLPAWDPANRLEVVKLPAPARLRDIARLTGVALARVRELNAGYRLGEVTSGTPMHLLLPAGAAQTLQDAIATGQLHAAPALAHANEPLTYTVNTGDTLWGVAHRFHVDVMQLRHWNDMRGSTLRPGQVLRLEPMPTG